MTASDHNLMVEIVLTKNTKFSISTVRSEMNSWDRKLCEIACCYYSSKTWSSTTWLQDLLYIYGAYGSDFWVLKQLKCQLYNNVLMIHVIVNKNIIIYIYITCQVKAKVWMKEGGRYSSENFHSSQQHVLVLYYQLVIWSHTMHR